MTSIIKVNAGELADAVKFVSGKIHKNRKKPFPLLVEKRTSDKLYITDAEYQQKGIEVFYEGSLDDDMEIDARHLLKATLPYPKDVEIVISIEADNFFIQHQTSKLSFPRLDKDRAKTKKKPLPHVKPPEPKPETSNKRAEFDHTWDFSARIPLPEDAYNKKK